MHIKFQIDKLVHAFSILDKQNTSRMYVFRILRQTNPNLIPNNLRLFTKKRIDIFLIFKRIELMLFGFLPANFGPPSIEQPY